MCSSDLSVVALGTENVILRLTPLPQQKSGQGNGNPPDTPDDMHAEVTGTVVDVDKYLQLPPGDCAAPAAPGATCAPCTDDMACGPGLACVALQVPGLVAEPLSEGAEPTQLPTTAKVCLQGCETQADCSASQECRMVGASFATAQPRCVPRVGQPQVRCESASPSIFGGGDMAVVDAKGHFKVDSAPEIGRAHV